ncbi:hypothetical protein EV175_005852, partial [Coemansia sp. RSA 1933]
MVGDRSYTADMAIRPASNNSSSSQYLQYAGGVPRTHTHSYGSVPQTVTAKMVDPTVLVEASSADYGTSTPRSASSRSSVYSPNQYNQQRKQQQQQQQQHQQQPTLASLALADSRGELDRELEYGYYQQQQQQYPYSIKADYHRPAQGFYSEPTSAAGSPASLAQGDGRRLPQRGAAHSSDNAVARHSGSVPTSSALGVTFTAHSSDETTTITTAAVTKTKTNSGGGGGGGAQALGMAHATGQRRQVRSSSSVIAGDSNSGSNTHFGGGGDSSTRYTAGHGQAAGRVAGGGAQSGYYADAVAARSPRGSEIHLNNESNGSASSFYSSNSNAAAYHQQLQQRRQAEPSASFASADHGPRSTAAEYRSGAQQLSSGLQAGGLRGGEEDNKAQRGSTDQTPSASSPSISA